MLVRIDQSSKFQLKCQTSREGGGGRGAVIIVGQEIGFHRRSLETSFSHKTTLPLAMGSKYCASVSLVSGILAGRLDVGPFSGLGLSFP